MVVTLSLAFFMSCNDIWAAEPGTFLEQGIPLALEESSANVQVFSPIRSTNSPAFSYLALNKESNQITETTLDQNNSTRGQSKYQQMFLKTHV